MQFKILRTGEFNLIRSLPNTCYLLEDQWDDWFQYNTMYDLYIINSSLEKMYIGKVKIGQYAMNEGQRRPDLPHSFHSLSTQFFSLGQDSYYYENIKNLGDDYREELLKRQFFQKYDF